MTRALPFLIFPEFQILDLTGPLAAFECASRFVEGAYEVQVISMGGGLIRSSSGLAVDSAPATVQPCDTFMVAGGTGTRAVPPDGPVVAYIRAQAAEARRTASVCSGALLLAQAGLLDGRRATTHWRRAPSFQKRFPGIKVDPDAIFIKDGPVWTSAGITAGIALALALIEEELGRAVAAAVAKELVVYHRRPGGQSQFSALLDLAPAGDPSAHALGYAREHLTEPLSVEQLAEAVALSPRQFARQLLAETGQTPAKAVEQLRVEAARSEVEAGGATLDQIARRTGIGDPERMRRAFLRTLGQPPQALRRVAKASCVVHPRVREARPVGQAQNEVYKRSASS